MTKGIRFSFKSVFVWAGIAVAAFAAAMLVDFSPATPRQNLPAAKQARSGLSRAVDRPTRVAGSLANQLVANYGKLPLSFEANQGQTDGQVKFLSRGRGYSLFLTGDEAVLTLPRASQKANGKGQMAKVNARVAPRFIGAALPRPLLLPSLGMKDGWGQELEKPWDRRAGPALPSSSRLADSGESSAVLRMRLVGANVKAAVTGADELPGKSNYFIGNDPTKWRTNVPNYAQVKYQNVYPGVDLVYYGNQGGQLEYDFVVAPGADPSAIALDVGAGLALPSNVGNEEDQKPSSVAEPSKRAGQAPPLQIAADGDLVVKTDGGEVRFHKPVVYQEQFTVDSSQLTVQEEGRNTTANPKSKIQNRKFLDGHYILEASNRVGFQLAPYDHSKALFIDPFLSYSTYLGGSTEGQYLGNSGNGIAVDSFGNAYVTGQTFSRDFPTVNPLEPANNSCYSCSEAFVVKMNAAGSALVYSTYLGGSGWDSAYGIGVDSSGNAYVTGETFSTDFPTVNPFQATKNGGYYTANAFVAKFNAAGSALVYSTYLGGSDGITYGAAIALDAAGNAFVTGPAGDDLPTVNPLQTTGSGFVAKLNAAGSALVYSTYLGAGSGIAVDSSDNAYVTGSPGLGFTATSGAYQTSPNDIFVAKLNAAGSALVYSTYLGGSAGNSVAGIAVDSSGNAYVTGRTFSTDFPTVNPIQATNHNPIGCSNAFVTMINAAGSALVYSTYLGGTSVTCYQGHGDYGSGIAVDSFGNAYVTGETYSTDFPIVNPIQATNTSCSGGLCGTGFVAELSAAGSALVYSTYLGGSSAYFPGTQVVGIVVDSSGNSYVTGQTNATDFPTVNPTQATCISCDIAGSDAFVAKISPGALPAIGFSATSLTFALQDVGTTSAAQTETVSDYSSANLSISKVTIGGANAGDFAETNACGAGVAGGANCTISVTFTPTAIGTRTGTLTITDNNQGVSGSQQTVSLTGTANNTTASVSPTSFAFGTQVIGVTSTARNAVLTNTGPNDLVIFSITITGANGGDFVQTNTCPLTLVPAAIATWPTLSACGLSITFTPSISGVESATLEVNDNTSDTPQTVALTGTGVVPLVLAPTSANLGNAAIDAPGTSKNLILQNIQAVPLSISSITLSNPDFTETNTCGGGLAAGAACTISVTLTPSVLGTETATLTVNDGAPAPYNTVTSSLTGTGVPQAVVAPTSGTFPAQSVGTPSAPRTVMLKNNLLTALTIGSITFAGADPGDFVQTNTCNGSVAAKSICTISVTFTPTATGTRTATLTVTDSANNSPQTLALTGTGQ